MIEHETKSYRVKFSSGDDRYQLAGIIDRPQDWDDQDTTRTVAVYSHCFTCGKDLKATVRICRALAKAGIGVLRFDMTGIGGSEGDFSETNFTTNLADIAAAIRFAAAELGPVTALIGHSFGGVASLVTAARSTRHAFDPPLQSLRFVATLAAPSDTQHLATLLAVKNPLIESAGEGTVNIGGVDWSIKRQMLDDFRRHDVTAALPNLRCPVLLLHSPVDKTVGIDHAIRLMSIIHADRLDNASDLNPVSLVALPGADHLLTNNPDDLHFVSCLLVAWCQRY